MDNKKLIQKIIEQDLLHIVFQPIISLTSGNVFGYEALTRGPENTEFESLIPMINAAREQGLLYDLEYNIFEKMMKRLSECEIESKYHFFVHTEPESLIELCTNVENFDDLFCDRHVVFEITERFDAKNIKDYSNIVEKYRQSRMQVAIGNYASETYSFNNIKVLNADYIKIDILLVKDIHLDLFKKSVVVSIVKLAEMLGMKTIAEGIEKREELRTLIELGVDYGQGYYISPPMESVSKLDGYSQEEISKLIIKADNENDLDINTAMISNIVEYVETISKSKTCLQVRDFFAKNTYEGVCVVDEENHPIGLVMKNDLSSKMATRYGYSIYANRKIELVMDCSPVIVDCKSSVKKVSEIATFRSSGKVYDNIIVTKEDKYYGMVSVRNLLMHITSIERNYAKNLNPLTLLPGNQMITYNIKQNINAQSVCAIFYADLDNFKIYNDIYGFDNGDKVIKLAGSIIEKYIKRFDGIDGFVGHVGGDDFVFIINSNTSQINVICRDILSEFSHEVKSLFNEKDRINEWVEGVDREGKLKRFDLTSLSIAGFVGTLSSFEGVDSFGEYIGKVKREAKLIKGNSYIIYNSDNNVLHKYSDKG